MSNKYGTTPLLWIIQSSRVKPGRFVGRGSYCQAARDVEQLQESILFVAKMHEYLGG